MSIFSLPHLNLNQNYLARASIAASKVATVGATVGQNVSRSISDVNDGSAVRGDGATGAAG